MASLLILLILGAEFATSQVRIAAPVIHSTGWNSSFELSPAQLELGNLTAKDGKALNTIINFDRSLLANGGAHEDDFYNVRDVPKDQWPTKPGKTIKLQNFTDLTPFALPPKTAMSRFVYSTTNANGTMIPASAYILWPYQAKKLKNGENASASTVPVVLWTHGTSGFYANGAPSTHRSLFYENFVPFALAEAGYAVVAPDYAGLGVDTSWDGTHIPHQYFPGGAVGWRLSEILAKEKSEFDDVAKNYLGAILVAPPTNIITQPPGYLLSWIGKDLDNIFPSFRLSEWLTPLGVKRTELLNQLEGSQMVTTYLFAQDEAVKRLDWRENWSVEAFEDLANPGNMTFRGPLLIFHGTADPVVQYNTTDATVKETCKKFPNNLEFVTVPGAGHFSAISAGKQTWLQWIDDRFQGHATKGGCVESTFESFWPEEYYQMDTNSFTLWAGVPQWQYELPTAS
ncbi:hypothetical protein N7532_011753 [Penicillium argentinense]|uniref:Secretory lipase n=1 Tax=Penicillium argentinense TaxID=1131581 RepID=A0A9W9JV93_9EURO|nr:uncharacterized protein N7532_011753 [Penicillium argentinense]KAJ5082710.1 hypothetical protein N7532_011753 [Penicillium argentinense]